MSPEAIQYHVHTFGDADMWIVPARKADVQLDVGRQRNVSEIFEKSDHTPDIGLFTFIKSIDVASQFLGA
jgi:hypothetical protein